MVKDPMTRFGIYLPNVGWETLPGPSELVDYAVAAEQMGFDSLWVEDRLLHPSVGILEALKYLRCVVGMVCYLLNQHSSYAIRLCNSFRLP